MEQSRHLGGRWHVDFICIDLTFVTPLDVLEAISFHSQPVIGSSEDFLGHCMSIGMGAERTFMNFLDEHVCFLSIQASE